MMAILTAAQLQTRLSLLARGVLGLAIFWAGIHTALRHLRSPVQCLPPQPVSHSSIDTTSADIKALASEDDERVLRCETGYVIDGFQPLTSALMVCKDAGGGNYGEWQCSASADVAMEVSWRCASRACVEVSHCDPLPDTVDTGCALAQSAKIPLHNLQKWLRPVCTDI